MIILGEDVYIEIHDVLDSDLAWRVMLENSGSTFNFKDTIPQVMDGLPRAYLPTIFNIVQILFHVLDPFVAYLVNHLLVHSVAFLGMYILLKNHFSEYKVNIHIALPTAFCFAILPFYTLYGLTIAGQPLLLWAFINIYKHKHSLLSFFIICFFPLYSSFLGVGVFILALFGAWLIIDRQRKKTINIRFLLGLILLAISYLLVEFNLLYEMFIGSNEAIHRVDRYFSPQTFSLSFNKAVNNFTNGQYHAVSLQQIILLVSVPLAFLSALVQKRSILLLFGLLLLNAVFSILLGFRMWEGITAIYNIAPILGSFNYARFHWLHPIIWYVIFAASLSLIWSAKYNNIAIGKYVSFALIAAQIQLNLSNNLEIAQITGTTSIDIFGQKKPALLSYKQFYSEQLFTEIKGFINRPQNSYRIVSIGMHPSISQYNGFYTLDGYQYVYPLAYKYRFRRIIEKELDKSSRWKKYFDDWGNRCYILVSEIDNFMQVKSVARPIKQLDLNTSALNEMGGEYVFSSTLIINNKQNNLELLKIFESNESPWKIHLYQIK